MNIKRIRFDEFGTYRDWSFTTGDNGVQLMYGPNESGKTSLLEGMRTLLFGGTHKAYGPMTGALDVDRRGLALPLRGVRLSADRLPVG